MAVVPDPRWRVTDATGAAVVGATMTIYTAGTTTPVTVYSDAALVTPITLTGANASDGQGYFPQWFAAEGVLLDITVKTSGGATVADRTYVSVPSLGSGTGSLTRDFTGSRLRIANLAGVVRVEGGPAVGDDTGGLLTLGGYDGTQSDGIVLDGLSIDTTGPYLEQGKKLPGVVAVAATPFSAVASVVIPLTNSPAGVLAWDVDIFGLFHSATSLLTLTVSIDGGATYVASGYAGVYVDTIAASVTPTASSSSKMTLGNQAALIAASPTHMIHFRIVQASTSAGNIIMKSNMVGTGTSGSATFVSDAACTLSGGTRASHVKLTASTGTISGSYRVVPQRGFGE